MKMKKKKIKLDSGTIQYLSDAYEEEREPDMKEYEGMYIMADPDTGTFDSFKSAMVDYDVYLQTNDFYGVAKGGYYIQGEHSFNDDLEFVEVDQSEPEKSELTKLSLKEEELDIIYFMIDTIKDDDEMFKKFHKNVGYEDAEEELREDMEILKEKLV